MILHSDKQSGTLFMEVVRTLDGDWIESYMKYVDNIESPLLFSEWTAVFCISSALQRKTWLDLGHLAVYPNFYVMLVGGSGTGKSVAMSRGRYIVGLANIPSFSGRITNEALIREFKKANTLKVSGGALYDQSVVISFLSEFASFIGEKTKAKQLVADLCDLYDCPEKWEYRTKDQSRTDILDKVFFNMMGAMTPTNFRSYIPAEAIGGGFTSRMICVYEMHPSKIVPLPFLTEKEKKLGDTLALDLAAIHTQAGKFKFHESFLKQYTNFYFENKQHPVFDDPVMDGYNSRRALHLLKLSMVMSASRGNSHTIIAEDLERSLDLIKRTEVNMLQTFQGVGNNTLGDLVTNIITFLVKTKTTTVAEIHRRFMNQGRVTEINECLEALRTMKAIKQDLEGGGNAKITYIGDVSKED